MTIRFYSVNCYFYRGMLLLNEKIQPWINYQFQLLFLGKFPFQIELSENADPLSCKANKNICRFYSVKEMYCINFLIIFDNLSIISWLNTSLTKKSSAKLLNLLKTFFLSSSIDKEHLTSWRHNNFMGMLNKYFCRTGFIENTISLTFP